MNTIGAPTSPITALIWRAPCRSAACSAVAAAIDPFERDHHGAIEVGVEQKRQHVVVEDRLTLAVREERGLEPGGRVELDLAVEQVRFEIEEDRQPVVEPGAPNAPLVDQGPRLGFGRLRR